MFKFLTCCIQCACTTFSVHVYLCRDHTLINPLLLTSDILIVLANFLPFPFAFNLFVSAIAIDHDSSFDKDQDILVLPLDSVKFNTHEQLTQDVLKHFGKVLNSFFCLTTIK